MKAILVIEEMPESCGKCRLADFGKCWGSTSYIHMSTNDIPKECPLKPLPTKITTATLSDQEQERTELFTSMALLKTYADGWNDCLEGIEK